MAPSTRSTADLRPSGPSASQPAAAPWGGSDPVQAAYETVSRGAFSPCSTRQVGLELELHLFDRRDLGRRPGWETVSDLVTAPPVLPGGSVITVEPGGQVELSAPPAPDLAQAVRLLRADEQALRSHCDRRGLGLLGWGADPLREPRRINPGERYLAMEEHFAARGCATAAAGMMTATASLQVNLDTGEGEQAEARWRALHVLRPVLVAVSACSPLLGGRSSGWASMREQQWAGLDAARTRPVATERSIPAERSTPAADWAAYALEAPVMLVADRRGSAAPVRDGTTFAAWLRDPDLLGRPAGPADLAYHLTTLFPPVRPRGFVEVRCLDATGPTWWPALVALTTTLLYDDDAVERVLELCHELPGDHTAARDGLRHVGVRAAASACIELAASSVTGPAAHDLEGLASLVGDGRSPGDLVRARIDEVGVHRALEEALDA